MGQECLVEGPRGFTTHRFLFLLLCNQQHDFIDGIDQGELDCDKLLVVVSALLQMLNLSLKLAKRSKELSKFLRLQGDNAPINLDFFRQISIFHFLVTILIFLD